MDSSRGEYIILITYSLFWGVARGYFLRERAHIYIHVMHVLLMVNAKQMMRIVKADRIMASVKKAKEKGVLIDEKKLVSMMCLEFGSGKRYIKEIMDDLVNVGKIKRKDGGITA